MKKLFIILSLLFSITLTSANAVEVTLEAKITGLYVAFFNRAADKEGLDYWTTRGETAQRNGDNISDVLKELSAGFATHPTFISTYSSLSNQAFVAAIYRNALGRDGDAEGIGYWTGLLNNGKSRADMVAEFVELSLVTDLSPENYPNLTPAELAAAQLRQDLITNKVNVSLAFTTQLGELSNVVNSQDPTADPAYLASIKIISEVTEDVETVSSVLDFLASIVNSDYPISAINDKDSVSELITLLGGKTFYAVEVEYLDHLVFNADVTASSWTTLEGIYSGQGGSATLSIDGEDLIVEDNDDPEDSAKLVLAEDTTDYLEFNVFLLDGTPDGVVRFYFDQAKGRAYYDTLYGDINTTLGNDIIGTWYLGDASQSDNIATLTFFSNGSYVMLEDGNSNNDPNGWDGMERGTYSWNETTGELQADTLTDTNGEWGLSHPISTFTFMVENNVLTITEGEDVFTLNRVVDELDDIIGTWYLGDASQSDNIATLTFFSNGSYVMLEDGNSNNDPNGWDGMERGTYSWNETTGELQADTLTDTNGEWGLSHPISTFTFMVENNVLTITEGEDVYTLNRYPLEITEAMLIGKTFYNSGTEYTEYDDNTTAYEERYTRYTFSAGELTLVEINDGAAPVTHSYSYEIIDGKIRGNDPGTDGDPDMYVWWTLLDQSDDSWTVRDEEDIYRDGSIDYTVGSTTWYLSKPAGYPEFSGETVVDPDPTDCSVGTCVLYSYYPSGALNSITPFVNSVPHGIAELYYESGALWGETTYVNGILEGIMTTYYENGVLNAEIPYVNGVFHGNVKQYYESGVLLSITPFVNGVQHGIEYLYLEDGSLLNSMTYINGVPQL